MQITSKYKTVRNNTKQGLKISKSQSPVTQCKKVEKSVSMMPCIKKTSDIMGDNKMELSFENETINRTLEKKWCNMMKNSLEKPKKAVSREGR